MLKLSEYLGNYINKEGEKVYYYRPTLPRDCQPYFGFLDIDNDPEVDKVEILEIPGTLSYIISYFHTSFPNLKKLIVLPSVLPYELCGQDAESDPIFFGHKAFCACPNLKEVHLHRYMCFANREGKLDWVEPFSDSKDVVFCFHTSKENTLNVESNKEELDRWHLKYKVMQDSSFEPGAYYL